MAQKAEKGPGFIKRSLGMQVTLLIAGITIFTLSISAVIGDYFDDAAMYESMEASAAEMNGLLRIIVDKSMLVGDDVATSKEFAFLAKKFPEIHISIASFNSNITYSTRPNQIRKDISAVFAEALQPADRTLFQGNYQEALKGKTPEGRLLTLSGRKAFLHVAPIFNEKNCHHCHGASQPVLGAMAVLQDVQSEVTAATNRTLRNAAISLTGGVLLVLGIFIFIKRRMLLRMSALGQTSRSIVEGNFNARFTVSGADEIGYLAGNLADMLRSLKTLGHAQSVMHGIRVPAVMCDTSGKISFINEPLLALLQDPRQTSDMNGVSVNQLLYGSEHRPDSVFTRVLNSNAECLDVESSLKSSKGRTLHVRFDANPVADLEGRLIGAFSTITDLTAIRENEASILEKNETINKTAREANVLTEEMGSATGALAGQIEVTREQAARQQTLSDTTVAELEQINLSLADVARNASHAAEHAGGTRESAEQGSQQARRVAQSMEEMVRAILSLKEQMVELGAKTEGIGQVMQVIQDIADQTNLLALNAAIEAARAGDAGRGFAVVADEVRKLAEKTMQATVEVGRTINEIRESASTSIKAVEKTSNFVTEGSEQVKMTGELLQHILALAESVAGEVHAIAAAVEEQSASTDSVRGSIQLIRDISDQAAHATTQTETAVRSLMDIARSLNSIVAGMTGKES
ncbi:methyl-accepting chemotaxis protein [Desulfovibrio sp. OttesenSCG-928-A18]|nr:methyl-accepting chemotaxis protein [Desulfovibrio sp. OttesenSCG-928-A18]